MDTQLNIIEGNPTKKFFIEMITRDISIEDAIIDLLDNSIDGANRLNPDSYEGLEIKLTLNDKSFIIKDNCGGFSLETAQKYAFRFGRPDDAPKVQSTIGRFGIGMKRSLFKMGRIFTIDSQYKDQHFKVDVNVDEWSKKTKQINIDGRESIVDDWSFNYQIIAEESKRESDGTVIIVQDLNSEVKELFNDEIFCNNLVEIIQKQLNFSILKGLTVWLNDRKLEGKHINLLMSDDVVPYHTSGSIQDGKIQYKIVAGLGEIGIPKDSGWYIYCNNRLVVEADTSHITGWGSGPVPRWHIDYVMFRGVLFLDAEETINLPLTTTKKGIDSTSEAYQLMLPLMQNAMIQILSYLKKITQMKDEANDYRRVLCETLNVIDTVALKTFNFNQSPQKKFIPPQLNIDLIAQKRNSVRIAYDADKSIADKAKDYANVNSYKELGILTFNYYKQMERVDDE